ncbi:MAG: hypothetical protein AYK19_04040 [Theionarchaea archaeon DG-70-1]|nr:MAG: hypothetical protein AYK19_04040 [Theionarchaea archaeon DG-70-1]
MCDSVHAFTEQQILQRTIEGLPHCDSCGGVEPLLIKSSPLRNMDGMWLQMMNHEVRVLSLNLFI